MSTFWESKSCLTTNNPTTSTALISLKLNQQNEKNEFLTTNFHSLQSKTINNTESTLFSKSNIIKTTINQQKQRLNSSSNFLTKNSFKSSNKLNKDEQLHNMSAELLNNTTCNYKYLINERIKPNSVYNMSAPTATLMYNQPSTSYSTINSYRKLYYKYLKKD